MSKYKTYPNENSLKIEISSLWGIIAELEDRISKLENNPEEQMISYAQAKHREAQDHLWESN